MVRVRQILLSLLGNAVKFTSMGGVRLRVAVAHGCIAFHIKDTGLAEDKKDVIFEPFTQADASVSREFHGTGLAPP